MKFRLSIKHAYDLQLVLNSCDNLRRKIPNTGVVSFEKRWASLSDREKQKLLSDIRDVLALVWPLRSACVEVDAEITE
jgi:hypothetical protein